MIGFWDWVLILAYIGLIVGVGLRVSRREKSLEAFVLAGRQVPWWAVLGSILAAETSAATFLGLPGEGYTLLNYTYLQIVVGMILGRLLVAGFFLKTYYDRQVYSIYEFLQMRFGPQTRGFAAAIFLISRILASGTRLFVSAIIVVSGYKLLSGSALTGIHELGIYFLAILLLTALTAVYTAIGGIRAVIWTDCIQATLMMVAGGAIVVVLFSSIPGGWHGLNAQLAGVPLRALASGIDGTQGLWQNLRSILQSDYTLLAGLLGSTFTTMASHGTDQDMVQRMLTAKDVRQSRRSLVLSGLADLPIALLFLSIGILLWVHYQVSPDATLPKSTNEIFCHFILTRVPNGVRGLVLVGILATTMGSLSCAMNALATSFVRDFYVPYWNPRASDSETLRALRQSTPLFGAALVVVGTLTAAVVIWVPGSRILPIALGAFGYTYGSLLGVFLVGLLTRSRGSDRGNTVAVLVGFATVAVLSGLPNDLTGVFGHRLYAQPDWLPVIHFTWRIFFGTLATFATAVCWPSPRSINP